MGSKLVWDQSCHEVKVFGDKINGIKVGLRAKLSWSQSFWGQSKWDQSWFGIKVVMKSKFFRTKKMGSKLVWGQKKMGSKLSGQSFRGKVEYNRTPHYHPCKVELNLKISVTLIIMYCMENLFLMGHYESFPSCLIHTVASSFLRLDASTRTRPCLTGLPIVTD